MWIWGWLRRGLKHSLKKINDIPRELALMALTGFEKSGEFSSNYLDRLMSDRKELNERDRAFISNLVQGVVRWRYRLDSIIDNFASVPAERMDPAILNIIRLALYQIFFLDRVPESAAVNSSVNLAKVEKKSRGLTSFVNGILRNILRNRDSITYPDRKKDPTGFLGRYYSYPEWLVKKWIKELGIDFTEDLLEAQNSFPDMNIRTNLLKVDRESLVRLLADEGVMAEPLKFAPEGLCLKGFRGRVERLKSFEQGLFQVQDQAAQIVTHLMAPEPGDVLLDLCSGLGGKSGHIQELMKNRGKVLAIDNNYERLKENRINNNRLGVLHVWPVLAGAEKSLSWLKNKFGKVLVDAPCSGLGVISRHPDIKWNRRESDIKRLSLIQKNMVEKALSVVEENGTVLYVVCTISKQENEDVVEHILRNCRGVSLVDLNKTVPEWGKKLIDSRGFFRSFPNIHNMDGFFAALFRKV